MRITDNVTWLPHRTPLPTATTEDLIVASVNNLATALLHHKPTDLLPPLNTDTRKALLKLGMIFANQVHPTDAYLVSTPLQEQHPNLKDTAQVPRVKPLKETTPERMTPEIPPVKLPYVPPASTAEYLTHNSTQQRLRRQNRAAVAATNCGIEK